MKKFLFLLSFVFFLPSYVTAQQSPVLEFYHGAECPHCHEEKKWFPELREMYPSLEIQEFEVWHDEKNKDRWIQRLAAYGMEPRAVPTNIFENEVIVGFDKKRMLELFRTKIGPPKKVPKIVEKGVWQKIKDYFGITENWWKKYLTNYSWPVMSFILGLIDGFNPCAMWTLMILLGFLLTMDDRKKMWLIGGVFIGSSGIIYFSALLAYLFGFSEITTWLTSTGTGYMEWAFRAVGILAIGTGGISLWVSRKATIECDVRDADSKKRFHLKMSQILERENFIMVLLGITGLAFSVNAIELLCSFAIPTTFTATLISLGTSLFENIIALIIYTIAYMLDDIIVFCIAMWTLSLTVFSPKIVRWSHFFGGLFLIILGGILLWNPSFLTELTT